MRFKHSLVGYKPGQTDSLLQEAEQSHQAAVAQKQSELNELLTYQQLLQIQQGTLARMLDKARARSDVFDTFSEALQQYFGRSEQRNDQEIQRCREAAAQLEAEINQQGERVESDIITLETFLASVEKHLGDLVSSLGQEFAAGQELLSEYKGIIETGMLASPESNSKVDLDKLQWKPEAESKPALLTPPPAAPPPEISVPESTPEEQPEVLAPDGAAPAPEPEGSGSGTGTVEAPAPAEEIPFSPIQTTETSEKITPEKARRTAFTTDDDNTILAILKVMLEREGFEVIQAADGREATRYIDQITPPDIAILDLMLPYTDGLQLTKQIRSKPEWNETPILILSSNSTENEMVTLLEAGADDYVIKPFNTRELIARVKRLSEAPVK